jgi:hypothetical protein
LCLPNGRLNPAAVGWTRRPLHRANLRGWGRAKRWEYWGIVTPSHIVGLVASSLDYADVHGVYVLDRGSGVELSKDVVVPFARGTAFPEHSGQGVASVRGSGLAIDIDQRPDGTAIRATVPGVEIGLTVPLPAGHESLGVVIPWSTRRFQYTGEGRRSAGARHADGSGPYSHGLGGGLVRGARSRTRQVAVRDPVELGRRQRAGPGGPARWQDRQVPTTGRPC